MKACIIGSRSITRPEVIFPIIDKFIRNHIIGEPTIISGGANGVDSNAKEYAKVQGFDFVEFLPYHLVDKHTPFSAKHFYSRNRQMISNADIVLAIWDEESSGTQHSIKYAQKLGVPVMVVKVPKS